MSNKITRFWEIDFFRGIGIILMIIYHILYDLNYFDIYSTDFDSLLFRFYRTIAASVFIVIVGVSLSLSYSRIQSKLSKKDIEKKYLFRGLKIFGLGLLITLISWLFIPEGFIVFGILHLIGISIILAYPFLHLKIENLPIGLTFIIVGIYLKTFTVNFYWLLWLGFIPAGFFTVDYFPLLPWFGVVLIGIIIGKSFYKDNKRVFSLWDLSKYLPIRFICFLGRHSLVIYLLHQPLFLGVIYLFYFN